MSASAGSTTLDRILSYFHSSNGRLALVAVASVALTSASIFGAQDYRRRTARQRLRDAMSDELGPTGHATRDTLDGLGTVVRSSRSGGDDADDDDFVVDESLVREQLTRNYSFLGEDGMRKIRSSFVIVVGMGGVGSAAATMLVRSGVGRVRIIDFDQVTLSSLVRLRARRSRSDCRTAMPLRRSPTSACRRLSPPHATSVASRLLFESSRGIK